MKKLNIVFSVVLIAVAAFFFFYADTFKMLPGQTEIGPGAFPKAVCVGLAVCGVLLIIQELRKDGSEKAELFSKKLLIGIAAAVAYFVLLKILGFVLDSIWVVFVMMALLLNEPFKKAWPLLLPFTYGMDPAAGISMLLAISFGAIYGGSITAILIGTPGTPASAATIPLLRIPEILSPGEASAAERNPLQ